MTSIQGILKKSKIKGLKYAVFESCSVKHAAQFTKTLEEIADNVQTKNNSDIAKMIRDIEHSVLSFHSSHELRL